MNSYFSFSLMLLFLFATFDYSQAINQECKNKMDQCQTDFFNELKQLKFNDYENSYYQLCSSEGSYMRFVECIRLLNEKPDCQQPLHRELCNKRGIKISSYRYTWKSNIVHDICYRTSPLLDQRFFKHEKCISEVLNTPKWHCDVTYYEKTKKVNGLGACPHWKEFRECIYEKVEEHCGKMVANLSDYLFHTHTSYFSKYSICNLPGEPHTKCWLDSIDSIPRISSTTLEPSTTTTTTMKPMKTSTILANIISSTVPVNMNDDNLAASETSSKNNAGTEQNASDDSEQEEKSNANDDDDDGQDGPLPWPKENHHILHHGQHEDDGHDERKNFNLHSNLVREAKMSNVQQQTSGPNEEDLRTLSYEQQEQLSETRENSMTTIEPLNKLIMVCLAIGLTIKMMIYR